LICKKRRVFARKLRKRKSFYRKILKKEEFDRKIFLKKEEFLDFLELMVGYKED